jgi:hypothetical protein
MLTPIQSRGFSLARGFIVFIMPAVHSVMLYSSDDVKAGWLGKSLGFFAEGPGAQLFMFLMGLFIVIGRAKTLKQIITRSILIGISGYLLNLFRLVIPYYLKLLPASYISSLALIKDSPVGWQLFLIGDILQFASLAYLFCALLYRYIAFFMPITIITITVWWISPLTWDLCPGQLPCTSFLNLFIGLPPKVFFPVFPWVFYPLLGLVSGCVLRLQPSRLILAGAIATGLLLIIAGKLLISTEPVNWNNNFYRQGRGGTLLHSGISLLWIALFIGIAYLKADNAFLKLLNFLSRHITAIYIVQWIVIMWIFRVYGYNSLGLLPSLMAALISSILSFGITWLLAKRLTSKTKYEN